MENKYYTPEIEEFHVGFECEVKDNDKIHEWFPIMCTMSTPFDVDSSHYSARVKYLDREDIESLFEQEYDVYRPLHMYYGFLPGDTLGKSLISYNFSSRVLFIQREINDDSSILFNGTIKNKSELIKLLKQLGIN